MKTSDTETPVEFRHERAEIVFAGAALAFALFLLSQMNTQVKWIESRDLVDQPGFWPVMAVFGMVMFGAAEMVLVVRRYRQSLGNPIGTELFHWFRALEFVVWFLAYVTAVPIVGYLLSTLALSLALTLRLGYRSRRFMIAAPVTAFAIVVVFKSFLSVKIPGGAIYGVLPDALRNFMIINF